MTTWEWPRGARSLVSPFPSDAGRSLHDSARVPARRAWLTRHSARRAVARSGPSVRPSIQQLPRPLPRAVCISIEASWPHLLRPSTSRRRTGPKWMRGSSPRMTGSGGGLFQFPQSPGAGLAISLDGGRELRSLAYALTRGAQSRAPGRCAARDPGPWCGRGRGWRGAASGDEPGNIPRAQPRHAERNPTDHAGRGIRPLLHQAPAVRTPRGRRSGHRRRRHHRRDHRPHPGRGRGLLALGRRPLRQEHARPDPPAAGDRPHHQGVGASARRATGRRRWAHPDRDPAVHGARHHGRSPRAGTSPCR